jgi:regulatory protein
MANVTGLHVTGARVAVELDGRPWRTVPLEVVAAEGLAVGVELDRKRARALARALRRHRAERVAVRALARREHSRATLEARLVRSGVPADQREEVLGRAARAGLVDDERFAAIRARHVADRGSGDLLVLHDLERHGIDDARAREAISGLEPEAERAAGIVAARGVSTRTIRYLASRGFSEETLEALVADLSGRALR